jgi:ABC-2 type transport system permease protein
VLAQLGPLADRDDWVRLVGVASQITAAGGLLAFGVVLSWMIGREFADATITGLFALPITRSTIALAKLVTYFAWTTLIALALAALVAAVGLALGLGLPDAPAIAALGRLLVLTLLTALLALGYPLSAAACSRASPPASPSSSPPRSWWWPAPASGSHRRRPRSGL